MVLILLLQTSGIVRAQQVSNDSKASAREHLAKGVAAFDDRRFAEAAEEFEAAYKLSPAFVVLYNIGQVDVVLGRSVEAVDAFERYLKQGASSISAARRHEVRQEIEKQAARIGTIEIHTWPQGAEVRVDGSLAGKTPLSTPVRVSAGRHYVEATLPGYDTQVRELEVVGRGHNQIELALRAVGSSGGTANTPNSTGASAPSPPQPVPMRAEASAADRRSAENALVQKTVIERTFIEAPPVPPTRSLQPDSSTPGTIQRTIGYLAIAAGLTTATIGGIDAYRGANKANEARDRLAAATTGAAYDATKPDYDAGKGREQRGWIVAGVGAAVLIGGVVVLAAVPQKANVVGLGPWITAQAGGVVMSGAW